MNQTGDRVAQLEEEIRVLKAQLEQAQGEKTFFASEILMEKTETALHSIFDHSADGILLVDNDGIIREWSKGYEQISGLSKESVIGKIHLWEVAELLFPYEKRTREECEKICADIKEMVANMQHRKLTRYIKHTKTGEYRIFHVLYFPVAMPDGMMLGGISRDVTEEVRYQEQLEENERKLWVEKERLETLSDNLPEGTLYRYVFERDTGKRYMEYVSATWEQVTGLTPESVLEDIKPFDDILHPEDLPRLRHVDELVITNLPDYNLEVRINKKGKLRWLRISSHPYADGNKVIWDGIITDVTVRREAEDELAKHRENLEFLVKERTEELETANEELNAINNELDTYRSKLEWRVEEKAAEIIAQQKDLEVLSRRQAILIKVLKIMQSSENFPQAMNVSLAKIGEYAGVSRVYVFEKSADEAFVICNFEWHDTGITHIVEGLQIPIKILQFLFDKFEAGEIICESDIYTLQSAELIKILEGVEVKSTVCLPLSSNGVIYGFVGFDECTANRDWEQNEVELLKSLSQIISTATSHDQAETAVRLSQQTMRTVLDNINSNIFVVDMDSSKILFANKSITELAGNESLEGKVCWKVLQTGKTGICDFCSQPQLFDGNHCPTGTYHWEQFHEMSGRWLALASSAIKWIDGRLVHLNVSIDITDRKLAEMELIDAKEKAEESDKLKSAFLANVSHEIRTPLNGIVGFLQFLNYDNLSPARRNEYIEVIRNSSKQLTKIIDDIIDISKIGANQLNIYLFPVHLNELMNEMHLFFETFIQSRNKEHIELILDDSGFIDDCLIYVDAVRLRQVITNLMDNAVKFTDKGYIRFGYRQSAPDMLNFVIEDSGIGLQEDIQKEIIFEPFFQVEFGNNRLHDGTGLGLPISRSLVHLMGGDMWVKSTEGVGSSFYFTISYQPVADRG